jgi:hypothetical protein
MAPQASQIPQHVGSFQVIAIPVVSCTGGQYWNGSACTCLSGLEFVGGVCTVVRTCPSGHVWNGYSCVPGSSAFSIGSGISGSWYDPSQSGHGFFLEVINEAPDTLDFSWFTFDDYGNQAWIVGLGSISGDHAVVDAQRATNGRFPPNYDPNAIDRTLWGTLTFSFSDCSHGTVRWTSSDSAFTASGEMNLVRLTSIRGLACP